MSFFIAAVLSLVTCFARPSFAVEFMPNPGPILRVTQPSEGKTLFELCEEDECRVLGGRAISQGELFKAMDVDTAAVVSRLHRLRLYSVGSIVALGAFGLAAYFNMSSLLLLQHTTLNGTMVMLDALGLAVTLPVLISMQNKIARGQATISRAHTLTILAQRNVPKVRAQFHKFIEDLESILIDLADPECADDLVVNETTPIKTKILDWWVSRARGLK